MNAESAYLVRLVLQPHPRLEEEARAAPRRPAREGPRRRLRPLDSLRSLGAGKSRSACPERAKRAEGRRAWARLIQKVYEVNPLLCPRCDSEMKVVAVIADEDTVTKILRHLGLLAAPEESRAPPAAAPAASPASPPAQASLPLSDTSASSPTALFDSISRDLFNDSPAWDAPDPPATDPAAPDRPGADADPGPDPADFGDGDPPHDEDIASFDRPATPPPLPVSPRDGERGRSRLIPARREA